MLQPSPAAPSGSALQFLKVSLGLAARRIEIGEALGLDAAGLEVDEEQRDIAIAAARSRARSKDREIGNRAVRHRLLHTVEQTIGSGKLDVLRRRVARALEQRQRADRLARGDRRQPFCLLRLAPGDQQRFGGQINGRGERHRRIRTAHLLGDHAKLEMAGTCTTELLGDSDTEEAHLCQTFP